jgi:hypothetical protein
MAISKSNLDEGDEGALFKMEAEQARQRAIKAEVEAAKAKEFARCKEEAERLEILRSGYHRYWNHVMRQGGDAPPITMREWTRLGKTGQERVLGFVDQGLPIEVTFNEYVATRNYRTYQ